MVIRTNSSHLVLKILHNQRIILFIWGIVDLGTSWVGSSCLGGQFIFEPSCHGADLTWGRLGLGMKWLSPYSTRACREFRRLVIFCTMYNFGATGAGGGASNLPNFPIFALDVWWGAGDPQNCPNFSQWEIYTMHITRTPYLNQEQLKPCHSASACAFWGSKRWSAKC